MSKQDYYDLLGLSKGASDADIKKAFRKKAMELHPDRNKDNPKAEAKFKEVNEAYEVLKDGNKKAAYDRFGHAAFEAGMGGAQGANPFSGGGDFSSSFSDVFEDLFGDIMGSRGRAGGASRSSRGSDLRYNLSISLEDAFNGKEETIAVKSSVSCNKCAGTGAKEGTKPETCPTCAGVGKVRAQQGFFTVERTCPRCAGRGEIITAPCTNCSGSGRIERERDLAVNIPKGVETGTRIRLSGEGEAGMRGGATGDLYIFIDVQDHNIFERDGQNLYCRVPVPLTTAALGGEIEIPTINGGKSRVAIPAGSQSGKQMRLRNKGMPALRGSSIGDLFLELAVETPVNLTSKQKDLLRQFEKESSNNSPDTDGFFARVKNFWS